MGPSLERPEGQVDRAPPAETPSPADPSTTSGTRPASEVSDATGLVGVLALTGLLILAARFDLSPVSAAFLLLGGTALSMALWAVLVERVHRNPTTGLDFSLRHPLAEVIAITRTKMIGLGATFGLIWCAYFAAETHAPPHYAAYLELLMLFLPLVLLIAPIYVGFTTRHMIEPRDGLWQFGRLVCLDFASVDRAKITDYMLGWAIKAFFLAFMVSILPGSLAAPLRFGSATVLEDPVQTITSLVRLAFLFDVCFGTIGYVLTLRVLDSHIRSANPYLFAWVAALACYPPFTLMGTGGPLDYRSGTQEWSVWLEGQPALLIVWGSAILILAVIYAWATVVFGMRFSNLTHRGIITTGPYRFSRHPAYLSKNLMWWMVHVPFLSTAGGGEAVRNCLILLLVNAIYYARAKTEERHLMADPRYRAYCAWIADNGLLERLSSAVRNRLLLAPKRKVEDAAE